MNILQFVDIPYIINVEMSEGKYIRATLKKFKNPPIFFRKVVKEKDF